MLLLAGAVLWLRGATIRSITIELLVLAAAGAAVAFVPRLQRWFAPQQQVTPEAGDAPRSISRWMTPALFLVASGYLTATAFGQGRPLLPMFHDEQMFLVQTQMLAHGRLWLPAHPLADAFETFHIFVRPVYAPMHFPGTAMLNVAAVWLALPWWIIPAFIAGGIVALTYRITAELIDHAAGIVAAVWMLALPQFRFLSLTVRSQTPVMLLGLGLVLAWMKWHRRPAWPWAAAMGIFAGWAAITRPVEALSFALPVGVAMLWELRRLARRQWLITAAAVLLGAAPFLLLQGIFNRGVTGSWLRTPHQHYSSIFYPSATFGFHDADAATAQPSQLPQKQLYYRDFVLPSIREHNQRGILAAWFEARGPLLLQVTLPSALCAAVLPAGLLGLTTLRRQVVWAMLPVFVILYSFFTFFIDEYAITVAPVMALTALLGIEAISAAWPSRRTFLRASLLLTILVLSILQLPDLNRPALDVPYVPPTMKAVHQALNERVEAPAIVLFKFQRGSNPHEEPVYNYQSAWPDDAPIIRAHDLGQAANLELLRYYARRQPHRRVYFYDRGNDSLIYRGTAGELWARFAPAAATAPASIP